MRYWMIAVVMGIVAEPIRAQQAAKPDAEKVAAALKKGAAYLKESLKDQDWKMAGGAFSVTSPGGPAALAVLALLEAGVPANDPLVEAGLTYLRGVEPKHTYSVGLQTQAFCRADAKKDRALIERNRDWLISKEMLRRDRDGRLMGWSYSRGSSAGDNSNSHFAMLELHQAGLAGAKADRPIWTGLRDYWLVTQQPDGGWPYLPFKEKESSRATMTCAGLIGLLSADKELADKDAATLKALGGGLKYLEDNFQPEQRGHRFYAAAGIARVAAFSRDSRLDNAQKATAARLHEAAVRHLLTIQEANGSWIWKDGAIDDWEPLVSTSLALLALSSWKP